MQCCAATLRMHHAACTPNHCCAVSGSVLMGPRISVHQILHAHLAGLPRHGLLGHGDNQAVAVAVCRPYDHRGLLLSVVPHRIDVPQEHAQLHQRQRVPQDGLQQECSHCQCPRKKIVQDPLGPLMYLRHMPILNSTGRCPGWSSRSTKRSASPLHNTLASAL